MTIIISNTNTGWCLFKTQHNDTSITRHARL